MKRLAMLAALCGSATVASAWSIFGASALSNAAALAAESATAVAETESAAVAPPGFCISNFSKDGCEGSVTPGEYESTGCSDQDCRSIRVTGAVYRAYLKSSGLACGTSTSCLSRCDEFPDGQLTLTFDYVLRADSCCPYRGSWVGQWNYVTTAGITYVGRAHGTIGVGTNRKSECLVTDDDCEECYDVKNTGDLWLVGFEGSFRGTTQFSPSLYADELNFTCDGTWIEDTLSITPPFSQPFRVFNRFDGDHVDYCP